MVQIRLQLKFDQQQKFSQKLLYHWLLQHPQFCSELLFFSRNNHHFNCSWNIISLAVFFFFLMFITKPKDPVLTHWNFIFIENANLRALLQCYNLKANAIFWQLSIVSVSIVLINIHNPRSDVAWKYENFNGFESLLTKLSSNMFRNMISVGVWILLHD